LDRKKKGTEGWRGQGRFTNPSPSPILSSSVVGPLVVLAFDFFFFFLGDEDGRMERREGRRLEEE